MKIFKLALITLIISSITSCATYHLSTQSLMEQFLNANTEKKKSYVIIFPIVFIPFSISGNDLRALKCLDKDGNEKVINVNNHTAIRITKKDKTRVTFYFDSLIIKDSIINGKKSHFVGISIDPVKIKDIEKLEIQK